MRLIKLIAPTALIATVALFAPHASAQTMGEYATTTAGVGTGAGSMGTSVGNAVSSDDLGGGSSTWGASSLGASFDERAGAASGAGAGQDFEARAGSSAEGSGPEARWPSTSPLDGDSSGRFTDNDRFQDQERFPERNLEASGDRFPGGALDQNRGGLDTHYSSSSGLDNGYSSSSGLDNSSVSN
ncbi:MAG TPA: hypothetical protein VKR28_11380 [Candidatus Binatus sp.]|nr:hypothetical protein [Candidatus Binatus sp.]